MIEEIKKYKKLCQTLKLALEEKVKEKNENYINKEKIKCTIDKIIQHSSDCQGVANCDKCWLEKELKL